MFYKIYGVGVEMAVSPVFKVIYNLNSRTSGPVSMRCIAYGMFNKFSEFKGHGKT